MPTALYTALDALREIRRRLWAHDDPEFLSVVADPCGRAERYRREALRRAVEHVPYYRGLFNGSTEPLGRPDAFAFPILARDTIRTRNEELRSDELGTLGTWRVNTSGGSTGEPVRLLQDESYDRFVTYALDYWYRQVVGVDPATLRKLIIWGSEKDLFTWSGDWRKRLRGVLSNTRYVNSFSLTGGALEDCIKTINTFKPDFIRGYATSLLEVANYIREKELDVHRPLFLVSSAEVLTPQARETIQEVFARRIYDLYGSRECAALAGECLHGRLHVFSFNHHIEVVDRDGNPVEAGEEGRILVTTLHNRAMPLVRYDIGDVATRGPASCGCGCPLPTLERVGGRISDGFLTADGGHVHGEYFTHLFYFRDWVKRFQVVQEAYDRVRIHVVLADGAALPPDDQADITEKTRIALGAACQVHWEIVEKISPTPQGKLLYTLSHLYRRHGG